MRVYNVISRAMMMLSLVLFGAGFGPFLLSACVLKVFCFVSSVIGEVIDERAASLPAVYQTSELA